MGALGRDRNSRLKSGTARDASETLRKLGRQNGGEVKGHVTEYRLIETG